MRKEEKNLKRKLMEQKVVDKKFQPPNKTIIVIGPT
jgi:hypothetical protein